MRGAKFTVSKYNAVRMTSGSVDVQFGYPALRPCRSPFESAPDGSLTITAVTRIGTKRGGDEALLTAHAGAHHDDRLAIPVRAATG